jgi:hypothetical protein
MSGRVGSITTDIISDGLVFNIDAANRACYPKTGTTVTDTIDYDKDISNTGAINNSNDSTFFSTDQKGIFLFDGVDDYILVNGSTNSGLNRPGITNQITLEAWIYTKTFNNNYERIIARRIAATPLPYMLGLYTTSGNKYSFYLSGTSGYYGSGDMVSTSNVALNQWVHLVGTSDNVTRKIYINGVLDNTDPYSDGIYSTDIDLQIGRQLSGGYDYNGDISAIRIYDRALSAAEVLHNYNALKGRFGV